MLGNGQLTRCQQRKAALLARSENYRQKLEASARELHPLAEWVDLGIDVAHKAQAGWSVLAPLLSLGRGQRGPKAVQFIEKLAAGLALARSLLSIWSKPSREPCSAAVPAASSGGVSPPGPENHQAKTPGQLVGEDACATSRSVHGSRASP